MISAEQVSKVLTVSQINELVRIRIESDPRLTRCSVAGEVSNFKRHSSGHLYFSLKDEASRIRAVMFASKVRTLAFDVKDGMRIICQGSVAVFERDGQYQLYVDAMQPDGVGALYLAFKQLQDRLLKEGLFDSSRKRPIPRFPRRIGVVTSPTGAVIRDISTTLRRRYPLANVVLAPALVQGPTAADTIVAALRRLERVSEARGIDVIIVARGGGSLEELWPFNEEIVARAIANCSVPVVSAVGHETDFTICDFVSDVRAATPTAAAELVAPDRDELVQSLLHLELRTRQALRWKLADSRQRLDHYRTAPVLTTPQRLINGRRMHMDYLGGRLSTQMGRGIATAKRRLLTLDSRMQRLSFTRHLGQVRMRLGLFESSAQESIRRQMAQESHRIDRLQSLLQALNPLSVLERGYSVVYHEPSGTLLSSVKQVGPDDLLNIQMADGTVRARAMGEEAKTDERTNSESKSRVRQRNRTNQSTLDF